MEGWITGFMSQYGYLSVFLLVALENIFPPIPSEIILTFGGFLTISSRMSIPGVILFSTLGSIVGAIFLYALGRLLSAERLERLVEKFGRYLRVKSGDITRAKSWFDRTGSKAVFICRMIPLVRSLISIPAGMSGMRFVRFLLYTVAGTLIWNTVLVSGGALLGENWNKIAEFVGVYSKLVILLVVLFIVILLMIWLWRKRRKRRNQPQELIRLKSKK